MQEYPVAFRGARIITGEEEGAYGWITINYLLESFTKVGDRQNTHSFDSAEGRVCVNGFQQWSGGSSQLSSDLPPVKEARNQEWECSC